MFKKITAAILVFANICMPCVSFAADSEIQEVYISENFESGSDGFSAHESVINSVTNTARILESGGNHYLHLKKNTTEGDCFADFYVGKTKNDVVIEFDIKTNHAGVKGMPLYIRDSTTSPYGKNANDAVLALSTDGALTGKSGSYTMTPLKWIHVYLFFDIDAKSYSIKVGSTEVCTDVQYSPLDIYSFDMLRIYAGEGLGDICIDNFRVYSGTQVRDISGEPVLGKRNTAAKSDRYAWAYLKDKTAVHTVSGKLFSNGTKQDCRVMPVEENNEAYVSAEDFSALTGFSVSETDTAFKAGEAEFYKNSYKAVVNGSVTAMEFPVTEKNGRFMLPLKTTAQLLGFYVYTDNAGMYIVSQSSFENTAESVLNEAACYMYFERPSAEDYIAALGGKEIQRPFVLADSDRIAEIKGQLTSNARLARWHSSLIKKANTVITEDINTYQKPDGLRLLDVSNSVQAKIMYCAYAYYMTDSDREKYAEYAWKLVEAVCNFPDWNAENHFLDTGVMIFSIGMYYDWFHDWMDDKQRLTVYNAAKKFCFEKAMGGYYENDSSIDPFFATTITNWNGICNGSIAVAAMAMFEQDEEYLAEVLENSVRGLEYAVYNSGPDGAWDEGVGYWAWYLEFLTYFLSSYDNLLNMGQDFVMFPGMKEFGYFGLKMSSPEGNNNFHDSSTDIKASGALFWLGKMYGDQTLINTKTNYTDKYGLTPSVEDVLFYMPYSTAPDIDSSVYYRNVEAVSVKENPSDDNGMFFSAHGGKTEGAHYHYDAGAFIYDVLGERWALDLGKEDYNLDNPYGKMGIYRSRSEGHNTLTINPSESAGQHNDGFAPVSRYEVNENSAIAVMDLTSMYPETCTSAVRGFFVGDNKRSLTIRDELTLSGEYDTYWFMHTDAEIEKTGTNEYTLTKNKKSVVLSYITDAASVSDSIMEAKPLDTSPVVNGQTENTGISKIAIKLHDTGAVNLTVKLSPVGESITAKPEDISIADWSLDSWTEGFDDGGISGAFGREADDFSLYSDNLNVPTGIKRAEAISERISFYAAFNGGAEEKYIAFEGRKNLNAQTCVLGKPVEITPDGNLNVFGIQAVTGFDFVNGKWYKFDFVVKTGDKNTVTVYIDNTCIAQDMEFLTGERIDEINSVSMKNAYIDDYIHENITEYTVLPLTLTSTSWTDRRYMVTNKGFFTYCDEMTDISSSYLSKLGKKNIKSISVKTESGAFEKRFLIITTSQDEKIYMPVFDLGEAIYSGSASVMNFEKNPLSYLPQTIKIKLTPSAGCTVKINNSGTMLTVSEPAENCNELAVSIYPGRKECDIYVNGKLTSQKLAVSSENITCVSGYEITDAQVHDVKCYTGGYKSEIRIGEVTDNGTSVSVAAKSVFETPCTMIGARYSDNTFTGLNFKEYTINSTPQSLTVESVCDDNEEVKVMLWNSIAGMRPIR